MKKHTSTVAHQKRITLSDRDRDLFLDALKNPPEASKKLKKAIQGYKDNHQ